MTKRLLMIDTNASGSETVWVISEDVTNLDVEIFLSDGAKIKNVTIEKGRNPGIMMRLRRRRMDCTCPKPCEAHPPTTPANLLSGHTETCDVWKSSDPCNCGKADRVKLEHSSIDEINKDMGF